MVSTGTVTVVIKSAMAVDVVVEEVRPRQEHAVLVYAGPSVAVRGERHEQAELIRLRDAGSPQFLMKVGIVMPVVVAVYMLQKAEAEEL